MKMTNDVPKGNIKATNGMTNDVPKGNIKATNCTINDVPEWDEDLAYKKSKENIAFHKKNTEEEMIILDKVYDSLIKKGYHPPQANSIIFSHIFAKFMELQKNKGDRIGNKPKS